MIFVLDPVTKQKIVVIRCVFPKNGFVLAKNHLSWNYEYYQGNNVWGFFCPQSIFVFNTQEEAQLACTQHLNFLKECGYATV